jgi:hypothetical protein
MRSSILNVVYKYLREKSIVTDISPYSKFPN